MHKESSKQLNLYFCMANLYLTTENNEKAKLKSHDNVT